MVDAIFCNWVGVVAKNEYDLVGFVYTMTEKAELFYTDNRLLDSTNPV